MRGEGFAASTRRVPDKTLSHMRQSLAVIESMNAELFRYGLPGPGSVFRILGKSCNSHKEVLSLPFPAFGPMKGKLNYFAHRQVRRRQVGEEQVG